MTNIDLTNRPFHAGDCYDKSTLLTIKNTLTLWQKKCKTNHLVIDFYVHFVSEESKTMHKESIPPDFFCITSRFTEENIRERLAAELSQAVTKIDYCRALYRLQHIGCINLNQYASDAKRAIVFNQYQSKFILSPSDFCKARMTK